MEIKSNEQIVSQVQSYGVAVTDLQGQVDRVVIESNDVFTRAGDLMKVINVQKKKHDEARRALVDPLNAHVKFINDSFRPHTTALDAAKSSLKAKMDEWAQKEADRIAAEEAEARRKAEEDALAMAEVAEAAGATDIAEEVMAKAAAEPKKRSGVVGRSDFGTTTSIRKDWKFEVEDIKALCAAVAAGQVPVEAVMANEQWIRGQVNTIKGDIGVPGVRVYQQASSAVR